MIRLFKKKIAPPYEPTKLAPTWPDAYSFTLRSTPRHHDGIRAAIESTGTARCWFSEPLAYLRGQGVSIFRVEAKDLSFLDNLYRWWAETELAEAFTFDIALFFNNVEFVTNLRSKAPAEVRQIIESGAPRVTEAATQTLGRPATSPRGI